MFINNIETIVTTGPPHSIHLIGLELKRKLNINWISDFRDPWVNLNYLNRFHLLPFVKKYHNHLEDEIKMLSEKGRIFVSKNRNQAITNLINNTGQNEVSVTFYDGETPFNTTNVLFEGTDDEEIIVTATWTATKGSHPLRVAIVDPVNSLNEVTPITTFPSAAQALSLIHI